MFPSFLKRKSVIILAAAGFLVSIIFMVYGFAPVISVNGERASLSEFLKVQSAITNMDKNANNGVLKLSDDAIKERVFGNIIDKIFTPEYELKGSKIKDFIIFKLQKNG